MNKYFLLIIIIFISCEDQGGPSYGCMDINACNYDSDAKLEDGTCEYPSDNPEIGEYCSCIGESNPQILDCNSLCGGNAFIDCSVDGILD